MNYIPDEITIKIPVYDDGTAMVDIKKHVKKLIMRPVSHLAGHGELSNQIREEVAVKLSRAQSMLPSGYRLTLRCGYRPTSVQKSLFEGYHNRLMKRHPNMTDDEIFAKASKFIAPLDILPPHSTGGAVDITISSPDGKQLDMGSRLYSFDERSTTDSSLISPLARNNRDLLVKVMSGAGFVNYPPEWWHWSYGDRYWAADLGKPFAIYGSV